MFHEVLHTCLGQFNQEEWVNTDGFGTGAMFAEKPSYMGVDVVGKDMRGRIPLTIEIDMRKRRKESWNKLADIRAENKLWIYVTQDREGTEKDFGESKFKCFKNTKKFCGGDFE